MKNPGRYLILFLLLCTLVSAKTERPFQFRMEAEKQSAYVGEPIRITFTFSYPVDTQIAEANFAPPTFHDFWTKPGKKVPNKIENGRHLYRLLYIVTPQRAGQLEIEPARMDIGILKTRQKNTLRMERVKWKSIFSNPLTLDVKPLPQNTTLFGAYTLSARVDKNVTSANEPVNLTVTVEGSGNLEEIGEFSIHSNQAAVYADKPKITTRFENGLTKGEFSQKFAFISDRNFTIPALSLTFFDAKKKSVRTIKTAPITITVENGASQSTLPHLEKGGTPAPLLHAIDTVWILSLLGAFAAGIVVTLLWRRRPKAAAKKALPIEEAIKKAKEDKNLLALLLPYSGKDPRLDAIISQLEENLYTHTAHKIDRKKLAAQFKKYVTISPDEEEILL